MKRAVFFAGAAVVFAVTLSGCAANAVVPLKKVEGLDYKPRPQSYHEFLDGQERRFGSEVRRTKVG